MSRRLGVIFAACAVMLGAGVAAASASETGSARYRYSVRIIEIDRDGRSVNDGAGAAQVAGGLGQYFANQRDVLRLPSGTYVFAANIETLDSGGQQVSQTLAAVTRTVHRNITITFDARKGQVVTAALDVPGAVEQDRTGTVCAQLEDKYWAPVMWAGPLYGYGLSSVIPLYAVPVTGHYLQFNYASQFAAAGAMYFVDGQANGRIPARPGYSFARADLAKVTVEAKAGTSAGGLGGWELGPGSSCNDYTFDMSPGVPSSRLTQYVSAGPWTVDYLQGNSGNYGWSRTYAGRRSYLDVFGAAVRGPIRLLPYISNGDLAFQPDSLFGDPNQSGSGCCATVKMTLRSHGKVLKRSTTGAYGQFAALLRHSGWYNFSVSAKQKAPPGSAPADLSTMVTLSWRAHYDADLPQLEYTLPVSLARFEPQGLDMTNDAPPGGHTVTRMYLTRTGIYGYTKRYALRTVLVAESVNGGRSWRQLQVTRKPGYWAVTISDPAGGYVSLRARVTDVKGDSTVETIYRAYGVR